MAGVWCSALTARDPEAVCLAGWLAGWLAAAVAEAFFNIVCLFIKSEKKKKKKKIKLFAGALVEASAAANQPPRQSPGL